MTLWTWDQATAATGGICTTYWAANGVSIDTRTLQKGDLFVALTDVRDGHDFVAQALEAGAAAALVTHVPKGVSVEAPLLIVDDVLAALEGMARFARARMGGKVIGVTGSVGKTGTKEMLRSALGGQGRVHAAEKSFNNHWGVPLTLARMPQDSDYAVIEIGMNHAGEITPLAKMADLDVAIVTIVAPVHLAAFSGVEEIAHAKAEIFDGLRKDGTAIINGDIETAGILRGAASKVTDTVVCFGHSDTAEYQLINAQINQTVTHVDAHILGGDVSFDLASPGVHLAMNALAVLAACDAVGAMRSDAIASLATWTTPAGRGARQQLGFKGGQINLIDESYNANPTSMASALAVLAAGDAGRKVAFLADMGELGETKLALHAGLASLDALADIDVIHLIGPLMKALYDVLPAGKRGIWCETADQMVAQIDGLLNDGDTIMVKGSNYTQASKLVVAIKNRGA